MIHAPHQMCIMNTGVLGFSVKWRHTAVYTVLSAGRKYTLELWRGGLGLHGIAFNTAARAKIQWTPALRLSRLDLKEEKSL